MIILILISLIVIFIVTRWIQRRIRWRIFRWLVLIPVMTILLLSVALVSRYISVRNAVLTPENVTILDEDRVLTDDLIVTVSGTGTIAPVRQVALAFQMSAPVEEILVKQGESVRQGEIIAKLQAEELEIAVTDAETALNLQQSLFNTLTTPPREVDIVAAEASLNAARAAYGAASLSGPTEYEVEIARLQTELARNQLWQTQMQRDQIPTSVSSGLWINVDELDLSGFDQDVQDNVTTAVEGINQLLSASSQSDALVMQRNQAELSILQGNYGIQIADANYLAALNRGPDYGSLSSARVQIINAEIALNRLINGPDEFELRRSQIDLERSQLAYEQALVNREQAYLRAPFDGIVAQNNLIVGEYPANNNVPILFVDDRAYYVDLPIDETDIAKIQVGQSVEFDVDALPDTTLTGVVSRIAYTPQRIGQLVTYIVRVKLDTTDAAIRIGMSVTGRITVQQVNNVKLIRNRFIRIDRITGNAFVTIENESGGYEEIPVILGPRNELYSQIVSGLNVEDRVVLIPRTTSSQLFGGGG